MTEADALLMAASTKVDDLQRRAYATAALTGLLTAHAYEFHHVNHFTDRAFEIADAMLAEQKRREAR